MIITLVPDPNKADGLDGTPGFTSITNVAQAIPGATYVPNPASADGKSTSTAPVSTAPVIEWIPKSADFNPSFFIITATPGITDLSASYPTFDTVEVDGTQDLINFSLPGVTGIIGGLGLDSNQSLLSVSAPDLISMGSELSLFFNPSLSTISFPSLRTIGGSISTSSNDSISSILLPVLISLTGAIALQGTQITDFLVPMLVSSSGQINLSANFSLTNVDLSLYVPPNIVDINFADCSLTAASVNGIIARCVSNKSLTSGKIWLFGGNNSAPTGQGVADTATLLARGVDIETN